MTARVISKLYYNSKSKTVISEALSRNISWLLSCCFLFIDSCLMESPHTRKICIFTLKSNLHTCCPRAKKIQQFSQFILSKNLICASIACLVENKLFIQSFLTGEDKEQFTAHCVCFQALPGVLQVNFCVSTRYTQVLKG